MSGNVGNFAPMSPGEARAMAQITGQAIRTTDGGLVLPDGSYQPGTAPGNAGNVPTVTVRPQAANAPLGMSPQAFGAGAVGPGGPMDWTALLPRTPPQFNITQPSPATPATSPYSWPGNTPAAQEGTAAPTYPGVALQSLPGTTVPRATPGVGNPGSAMPLAHAAAHYRNTHGVATAGDADLLNQMSLAAAQQGRTFLTPGPYQGNVVASLVAPPSTSNMLATTGGRWQPTSGPNFLAGQPAYNSGLGPQY